MRFDNLTIALWGDTGCGKTYLSAELIDHLRTTKKQRSVVYMADRGWRTMKPQIDSGAALPVPLVGDPFIWLSHAIKGEVLEGTKWVKAPADVGLWLYEGGTSIASELKESVKASHADPTRPGIGPAANKFEIKVGDESLKRAAMDKGHFGIVQDEVRNAIWQSQDLPGIILWTFLALRKQDDDTKQDIIGPEILGKALTAAVQSWFHYSFHVDAVTPVSGGPEAHVLYTQGHNDMTTGNARAKSNSRVPPGADALPAKYEPASLVKVLDDLAKREASAVAKMKAKYGV